MGIWPIAIAIAGVLALFSAGAACAGKLLAPEEPVRATIASGLLLA